MRWFNGLIFCLPFCGHYLQKPGMDVADSYVTFVRHSQDMLREKVNEEVYVERIFDVSKLQCFLCWGGLVTSK